MKRLIVISAVNVRSGGTLSILQDFLNYLDTSLASSYKIIALVHSKSLVSNTKNINYIEFPKSTSSYLYRLYYEYFYFYRLSKELNPYLWLSLHDMTPRVNASIQAVYCHNPTPFYKLTKKDFFLDKNVSLMSLLYKFIYQINIHRNNFVIVQQNWMKDEFKKMFDVKDVIVANPNIDISIPTYIKKKHNNKKVFFFPSFPRVFKNFEVICDAVSMVDEKYNGMFEVLITIDGNENKYAQMIYKKYNDVKNIKFIGLQTREKVFEIYAQSDCLIFPSKLETWGLPISEYKLFNKPILAADLPYAHETVGNYNKVNFFEPDDAQMLARYIVAFLENNLIFVKHAAAKKSRLRAESWSELCNILLNTEVNK
jgi:glycosyltransferase involved in cell wall biosynthesis